MPIQGRLTYNLIITMALIWAATSGCGLSANRAGSQDAGVSLAAASSTVFGFKNANGNPLKIKLEDTTEGDKYECRFGLPSTISKKDFVPCDGDLGVNPYFLVKQEGNISGTYLLEVQKIVAGKAFFRGDRRQFKLYMHDELDGSSLCTAPTADELAEVALAVRSFAGVGTPKFGAETKLMAPNFQVQLAASSLNFKTLHKRLEMNSDQNVIAVTRHTASFNRRSSCTGVGANIPAADAESPFSSGNMNALGFVFSANNRGAFINRDATGKLVVSAVVRDARKILGIDVAAGPARVSMVRVRGQLPE